MTRRSLRGRGDAPPLVGARGAGVVSAWTPATWCSSRAACCSHATAASRSSAVLPRLAVSSRQVRAPSSACGSRSIAETIRVGHPADRPPADAEQIADPLLQTVGAGEQRPDRQLAPGGHRVDGRRRRGRQQIRGHSASGSERMMKSSSVSAGLR